METEEQRLERVRREEANAPIDVQWCVANGGKLTSDSMHAMWTVCDEVEVWWSKHTGGVSVEMGYYFIPMNAIQSQGQLRDLIRAMKGGAT